MGEPVAEEKNAGGKWWHWTYIPEWLGTMAITFALWAATKYTAPYCRTFVVTDPTLLHSYSHSNMFPSWCIPLISVVAPVVWMLLNEAVLRAVFRDARVGWLHNAHSVLICVAQGVFFAMCITDPLKNFAGRLRPDYIARLIEFADFPAHNATAADFARICDSDDHRVWDGRRSFPSGHSSLTWAGWTVAALYVYTRVYNGRRWRYSIPSLGFFYVAPCLVLPLVVAVSRTRDNRHNFDDVLAGSLIGIFSGIFAFPMHFSLQGGEVCALWAMFFCCG